MSALREAADGTCANPASLPARVAVGGADHGSLFDGAREIGHFAPGLAGFMLPGRVRWRPAARPAAPDRAAIGLFDKKGL